MKRNVIVAQLWGIGGTWVASLLRKHGLNAFLDPIGGWAAGRFDTDLSWSHYLNTRMAIRPSNNFKYQADFRDIICSSDYIEVGHCSLPFLENVPFDWKVIGIVRHPQEWIEEAFKSKNCSQSISWSPESEFDYAKIWLHYTARIVDRAERVYRLEDLSGNEKLFLQEFGYFGEVKSMPGLAIPRSSVLEPILIPLAERLGYCSTKSSLSVNVGSIQDASPINLLQDYDDSTIFVIDKKRGHFGDQLYGGWLVGTLIANGFKAQLMRNEVSELLDVPLFDGSWRPNMRYWECGGGVVDLEEFISHFRINEAIHPIEYVPVRFKDIEEIKGVDVAISCQTHNLDSIKNWPYFDELKTRLDESGISWVDLNKYKDFAFLNHVKKCKLYVGLETGATVYASQFAKDKSLIIRSGYRSKGVADWNVFNYETIKSAACGSCSVDQILTCPNGHACMKSISVEQVLRRIKNKLRYMEHYAVKLC